MWCPRSWIDPDVGDASVAARVLRATGVAGISILICGLLVSRAQALSLTENPFLQQAKLASAEVTELADQGWSVAISADGSTALVGSPYYDGFTGAAWVYVRSGSGWMEQAKLVGKGVSGNVQGGYSVAISANGDTALIGGKAFESGMGAAWVFTRSGSTWEESAKLVGKEPSGNAEQGDSVALSADGETALVGGYKDGSGVGAAWVFTGSGSTWTQQGKKLVGKHGVEIGLQGWSVALSSDGGTALIGGPKAEGEKGEREAGAAWVFTRSGSTWSEQAKLPQGSGTGLETGQGQSVALSGDGDTALVGGPGYEHDIGGAWAYVRSGEKWEQQGPPLQGNDAGTLEADLEGEGVALSEDGNTALIGGPDDDVSLGAAWAFVRAGSSWSEQEKLVGTGAVVPSDQGDAVALSADGGTALVGGPGDDGEQGATWVFTRALESGLEHKQEPEKQPEQKTSNNNNGGTTTTTISGSSTTPVAGIASTPAAVEELKLGCSKRSLVLNDVLIRGSRVDLQGSAAKSLDGKKIKIVFDGNSPVATATVGTDGEFSTTAPLPPVRLRDSNSARYMAESGSQRSLNLKLTRRLSLEPPTFAAGTVTLVGQVVPPLTKPVSEVTVSQELECGKTTTAGRFKTSASGHFRITLKVPAAAQAGIYRLTSGVVEKPGAKHSFATYSLPLPVILG
jgi:hypothetical protein